MPGILNRRTDDIEVDTLEEALALAAEMCAPGSAVRIHAEDCPVTPEHPEDCACDGPVVTVEMVGHA